jgi:hypothetical protein
MRIFTLTGNRVTESNDLMQMVAAQLPENGCIWIARVRREFEVMQAQVQAALPSLSDL